MNEVFNMTTTLCIDGHVHIYPFYNLQNALNSGMQNLQKLAKEKDKVFVWLLTERYDCDFFNSARQTKELKISTTSEKESLIVNPANGQTPLYICAGRQIVTTDNLEICALTVNANIKDRTLNTMDTIRAVHDAGGVATLNWAPGKWFFKRKKIVQKLLAELDPAMLLIGDTSLRPIGWLTPVLMKNASRRGFKIIAGSDPLPFQGEDSLIGSYGFAVTSQFDPQRPAQSIRKMLTDPQIILTRSGHRNQPITFMKRQTRVMMLKGQKNQKK
jgi:hypothetical protein